MSWTVKRMPIGEVCTLVNGRAFKPTDWTETGTPIVRIQNLNDLTKPFNCYLGEVADKHIVNSGDILLSWSGTPGTSFGCFVWSRGRAILNQHIFRVHVHERIIDKNYFVYAVNGHLDEMIALAHGGVGLRHITKGKLESIEIPVPPLPEQRRIVARIQELMSRADEIRRLRGEIAVEARAVLKSAVTERMAAFRGTCEQSALGALVGDRPGAMASGPFGSQLKHEEFVADGNLVIGIANVQRDRFDPVRKWMVNDQTLDRLKRYRVAPGDLLITVMGTVGRTCVVPHDIGVAVTSKHVYRVRLPADSVHPRFVSIAINFDHATVERLLGRAAGGVMPGLNSTKLRELLIPVPSRLAQEAFIEEIDRLKAIEHVLAHHEQAGDAHIQSSILRKAFAGEL